VAVNVKQDSNEFPVCSMSSEEVKNSRIRVIVRKKLTMEEYYAIEDAISSLARLRQYQWQDFIGKYKIF